ncbi:APUM5, partial [Symbiodinium sp. CCMP2456]
VFHHWYHIDDEGEADERRMEDDDPNAGLPRETVRRVVRQTGMSFTPEKKEILDKRLDGLEEAGLLRFHGFLRLMRWV